MGAVYGDSYQVSRRARLAFAEGRCEVCKHDGSEYGLEAHHAGGAACYELDRQDRLRMQDLVILCERCHDLVTDRDRRERYAAAMPPRPVPTIDSPVLRRLPPTTTEPIVVPTRRDDEAKRLPPTR